MALSGSPNRVLVVSAAPDASIRDDELSTFARTLHLRVDTRVDVVFLLGGPSEENWRQCCSHMVVVDHARTWPIAEAAERLHRDSVTNSVRGARLTWLLSQLGTYDVAILDQGFGADILERLDSESAFVVARWEADGPTECAGRAPIQRADLVLDAGLVGPPITGPTQPWTLGFDPEPGWLAALDYRRHETRTRLDIDVDGAFIVGIGSPRSRPHFEQLRGQLADANCRWAPDDDDPVEVIAAADVVIGLGDDPLDRSHVSAAWAAGTIAVCDLTDGRDQLAGPVLPDRSPALRTAHGATWTTPAAVAAHLALLATSTTNDDRRKRAVARVPDRDWIADQLIAAAHAQGRPNAAPVPLNPSLRQRLGEFAHRARSR